MEEKKYNMMHNDSPFAKRLQRASFGNVKKRSESGVIMMPSAADFQIVDENGFVGVPKFNSPYMSDKNILMPPDNNWKNSEPTNTTIYHVPSLDVFPEGFVPPMDAYGQQMALYPNPLNYGMMSEQVMHQQQQYMMQFFQMMPQLYHQMYQPGFYSPPTAAEAVDARLKKVKPTSNTPLVSEKVTKTVQKEPAKRCGKRKEKTVGNKSGKTTNNGKSNNGLQRKDVKRKKRPQFYNDEELKDYIVKHSNEMDTLDLVADVACLLQRQAKSNEAEITEIDNVEQQLTCIDKFFNKSKQSVPIGKKYQAEVPSRMFSEAMKCMDRNDDEIFWDPSMKVCEKELNAFLDKMAYFPLDCKLGNRELALHLVYKGKSVATAEEIMETLLNLGGEIGNFYNSGIKPRHWGPEEEEDFFASCAKMECKDFCELRKKFPHRTVHELVEKYYKLKMRNFKPAGDLMKDVGRG